MIFNMYRHGCWMDLYGRARDRRKWWGSNFFRSSFFSLKEDGASVICKCMHKDGWKVLGATPRNLHLTQSVATPGAVSMVTI